MGEIKNGNWIKKNTHYFNNIDMANMNRYEREIFLHVQDWEHWTADLLYKKLRKTYLFLSRGTVYRNLESLYQHGVIEKHYWLWDTIIWEIKKQPHCHIFCDESNKILDIQPIDVNIDNIKLPDWFSINSISVIVHGTFWDQVCSVHHEI
jgi:Fur family peroxide stress response transcriptional regulator